MANSSKSSEIDRLLKSFAADFPGIQQNTSCQQATIEFYVGHPPKANNKVLLNLFHSRERSISLYCVVNETISENTVAFLFWVYGKGQGVLTETTFVPLSLDVREVELSKLKSALGATPSCNGLDALNAERKSKILNK